MDRRQFLNRGAAGLGAMALGPVGGFAAPSESDLKITEVTTYLLKDALLVKLKTDSGIEGWGECERGVASTIEELLYTEAAPYVLGEDPFQSTSALYDFFYREHDQLGGTLAGAIAGLDIAMWDLKARILDVPIWRLLGGQYRDRMNIYGSYATDRWRKMGPKEAADVALKFVRRGFDTVKCRMQVRESALDPREDRTVEYIAAIKKKVPNDIEVFTDINNGYSVKRAILIGQELHDRFGMKYFEEPCSDQNHSNTRKVAEALPMYIIAGEKEYTPFQLQEMVTYADPDYLNPDVIKHMGITGMQRAGIISQLNQKPIIVHNTRPTVSTAASLQLAASYPIIGPFMEYPDEDKFPRLLDIMKEPFQIDGSVMMVPQGPGLGIEIDEAEVQDQARQVRTRTLEE
ncbi:MAG: mandelate racemase/muconate lactonizing enzyme family protein [Pseudomonadota bacterium]